MRTIRPILSAFVTGSRKYGRPTKNSDIDLVIFTSQADCDLLKELSEEANEDCNGYFYENRAGMSLRFGNLNLIITTTKKHYDIWTQGTHHLIMESKNQGQGVSKQRCKRYFKRLLLELLPT
jgi:hypothetical protein